MLNARVTLLSMLLAVLVFMITFQDAQAQAPLYPPGIGFNPAVDYNLPNYAYSPNLRKFVDSLPGLGEANKNNLGQYIPVAVPDATKYPGSDFYDIAARQYQVKMHSELPPTTLRGYTQLNTSDPTVAGINQFLGPVIIAKKFDPTQPPGVNGNGKPVRVLFRNEVPTTAAGPFFLPVDPTIMGAGMGPMMGQEFTHTRVSIPHLHGGFSPWISDGTPHQWVTPKNEVTAYRKGVSTVNVPDMVGAGKSIPNPSASDGMATLYWTNQQSGRLMFYHDHAWGITRLNVYGGVAAGYLIVSQVEEDLIAGSNVTGGNPSGQQVLPDGAGLDKTGQGLYRYGIPLVIMDKTFVNDATTPPPADFPVGFTPTAPTLSVDPLWGTYVGTGGGNLWMAHEYMPVQNIYDPTGVTWNGRWDYGAFMPVPMLPLHLTLPSPSIVPEAFQDTMMVNGTAFPFVELPPEVIRFRILNACNDRSINLQLYKADPIRINIVNRGSGYSATPTVTLTGGGGTYTAATAEVSTGEIDSITVDGSRGYLYPPNVTLTGGGGTYTSAKAVIATNGPIEEIIVYGATGYTSAPTVTITGGGGGTYTSAIATIIPAGVIKAIAVTGAADFRTAPTVTITDTTGTGARAVAVVNTEVKMVDAVPNEDYPLWPRDGREGGVPDPTMQGPPWILIGNECGLLAQASVLPQQPIDYEYVRQGMPPFGVTSTGLFLMPAQRADVVLDLTKFKDGDVVILYNDAPAPMSNFWAHYDHYTDNQDLTGLGAAPSTPAGFGPNTRTVMQIRITGTRTSTFAFDVNRLSAAIPKAFAKEHDKPLVPQLAYNDAFPGFAPMDVYARGQDEVLNVTGLPGPIAKIMTAVPGSGYTTPPQVVIIGVNGGTGARATATLNGVTGIVLTSGGNGYATAPVVTIGPPTVPGGIQARAQAVVSGGQVTAIVMTELGSGYTIAPLVTIAGGGGIGATAVATVTLGSVGSIVLNSGGSGYVNQPKVFLIGGGGMGAIADAIPTGAVPMTGKMITEGMDPEYARMQILLGSIPNPLTPTVGAGPLLGITRYIDPPTDFVNENELTLWRITQLGVDSHPLHFHLFDVQVVNRVDFGNAVLPPAPDEIGWRETIRINPMQDTIVAFRPKSPVLPFILPRSRRVLDPTTPQNSTASFMPIAPPIGIPAVAQLSNVMTDYAFEYVWHCHMLGHEENDFMRPLCLNVPVPTSPSNLRATAAAAGVTLTWTDRSTNESYFVIQRATNSSFTQNATVMFAMVNATSLVDTAVAGNIRYYYRIVSFNATGFSGWSNTVNVTTPRGQPPTAPASLATGAVTTSSVVLNWTNTSTNMSGFVIQYATNANFVGLRQLTFNTPNVTTRTVTGLSRNTVYYFRIAATSGAGNSPWSNVASTSTSP